MMANKRGGAGAARPCRQFCGYVVAAVLVIGGLTCSERASAAPTAAELDYAANVPALRTAADAGDAEAQYRLGCRFDYGFGVEKSPHDAEHYYELAALQGHHRAQAALGMLCNMRHEYAEGVHWLTMAAQAGLPSAQNFLGAAYEKGEGVPRSYKTAALWYQRSALQGDGLAMYALAKLYEHGLGVPTDLVKAYAWNDVSAAQGWGMAKTYREELEKTLTPRQLDAAQTLAADLFGKHGIEPKD